MKIVELNEKILPEWAGTIPKELFIDLMLKKSRHYAAGIVFMDEIAGAICWEENETFWELQSIYIFPEYRRLGLGSGLLEYLAARMKIKSCRRLDISYYGEDELVMLYPFLVHCGFWMETVEVSVGVTDVQTALKCLEKQRCDKKIGRYAKMSELTAKERQICDLWMLRTLGVHIDAYESEKPSSYVILDGINVIGILLFREVENILRLEYCKVRSEAIVRVIPLLAAAIADLGVQYPKDMGIEMILSNEQAVNLYSRLVSGKTEQATVCCGYLTPVVYAAEDES